MVEIKLAFVWEKPVLVFYRERKEKPERKAFAVVKARKLIISSDDFGFSGKIEDFFPLMGDIDYISTKEGESGQYVLCWFEDKEDDFSKAWRRLTGVTFPTGVAFTTDIKEKKTYNTNFIAKQGKL